jgi:ABC-type Fe3+/spermidine/putrescine transport system ATPase subunit
MRGAPPIKLNAVSAGYSKNKPVLKGIDFEVAEGQLVAVLGSSGTGKSTLLRLIAGLLEPTAGSVEVFGTNVTSLEPRRRSIGLVFQSLALFPNMTVEGNVGFGLRYAGLTRVQREERITELLESLRLTGVAHHRTHELSGGQAQRVALARALAPEPRILLLDEPFSSLDRPLVDTARKIVTQIHREKALTTLIVTHDREQALSIADRILVLGADGSVVQDASPNEVYNTPNTAEVASLTGPANVLNGVVVGAGDGMVNVRTKEGVLRARWTGRQGPPTGEVFVSVVVRPDWATLVPYETADLDRLEGTVNQTVFTGNRRYVHLEMGESGFMLECNGAVTPAVGKTLPIYVKPGKAIAYLSEQEANHA